MEERYMDDEKNNKILELDIGKPGRHVSRRHVGGGNHPHHSSCSMMTSDQNNQRLWCDDDLGF
jgi:hypothetical protein